jgi:hypothetical protein
LGEWIKNNFNELKLICKKVSRLDDVDDLLQICIELFLLNKKVPNIPDKEKLFFFARIVKNNFYSKSSPYYRIYKFDFNELKENDVIQEEYEESEITIEWVKKQLKEIMKTEWYFGRLFELYLEVGGSVTKLSKQTGIPINSVSRDINRTRKKLKILRENELRKL